MINLPSIVASVAWGLLFTRIAFIHISSNLSNDTVGSELLIKSLYIFGITFDLILFLESVRIFRQARSDIRQLFDWGFSSFFSFWVTVTVSRRALLFLALTASVISLGIGILLAGHRLFETSEVNTYHIALAALLFIITYEELLRS